MVTKNANFSQETEKIIKECFELISNFGDLKNSLEKLLNLEKKARLGGDNESTSKLLVALVNLCTTAKNWSSLNENIVSLSKKRQQSKIGITKMVQEAMKFVDKTGSKKTQLQLIETLRDVTEGKLYVELERARLTRRYCEILEKDGDVGKAADALQEVQVETVGTMEPKEKIDFILEQIRLNLDRNDLIRAKIISKKITAKSLNYKEHAALKIRYFELMIRFYKEKDDFLEIFKCLQQIYTTEGVTDNETKWIPILKDMVLYLMLSSFDNHQSDFMNRVVLDKRLEKTQLSIYRASLKLFVSSRIINLNKYDKDFTLLKKNQVFAKDNGKKWKNDLRKRIIEHNIRVISKYYSRISFKKLVDLLGLKVEEAESFISKMVNAKSIVARIDRIDGTVQFSKPKQRNEKLNTWANDTVTVLNLVEKSVHLINKETSFKKK